MEQLEQVIAVASSPGHLRIGVPRLYRSPEASAAFETAVARHPAIRRVKANPLTSRVLLEFEDGAISPHTLLTQLGLVMQNGPEQAPLAAPATGAVKHREPQKKAAQAPAPGRGAAGVTTRALYAPWHVRELDEALAFFASSVKRGLSSQEVKVRLRSGQNVIAQAPRPSTLQILLHQFESLPIILLGLSAGVSLLTGGLAEAAAISAVLVLNGAIGFYTERRAEVAVASLSELVDDIVLVLRDGAVKQVAASQVVPGDILLLNPGTRIVADLRLVEAKGLMIDESALTGESAAAAKDVATLHGKLPLAERRNMAYRGTAVAAGTGAGLAVGTGPRTEVGVVQALTSATERPKTRTQVQLDQLGGQLIKASSAMCVGIFVIGLLRGYDRLGMFKTAISLAIAAVPEGLPAVATTSLARGIGHMRERGVLIRHLHGVETIGAIQTLCLDKTGTLTLNRMAAVAIRTPLREYAVSPSAPSSWQDDPALARLLQVCALSQEPGNGAMQASATEHALLGLAVQFGQSVDALRAAFPMRESELRAEGRNFMRTTHEDGGRGRVLIAVKGSPDEVLAMCDKVLASDGMRQLRDDEREAILAQNRQMAARQLRVLGFAFAQADGAALGAGPLCWLGLVGLADPLRPGVSDVIRRFHQAGIATIMLTGDQAATAVEIGKQLHLNNGSALKVVSADEIDEAELPRLSDIAASAHIFSRVTPAHKLRIVQALQKAGQLVAMTGDGINDSPALRAADIGIAMGGGTDVALTAADIALQNDELETLLEAVSQGRTISANIRKSVHFLLSSNLSEILLVACSVGAGLGQPLTPLQLLWLNLLTDMLPAIALGAEAAESDVMLRPPRDPSLPIVAKEDMWRYVREGGVLAGGAVGAYTYGVLRYGPGARAGTIAFDTLVLGQMFHAMFCRSDQHRSLFDERLPQNKQLWLAILASLGLQAAAHVVPGLRRLLGISALGPIDIAAIVAGAALPVLFNEWSKPADYSSAATRAAAERASKR